MNKRIDIIYNTNEQEWKLERIAEKHGFVLTDNCYWVQIMRNQDGDSIVLTREDGELVHDPVERLTNILETTETETTETETTDRDATATGRRFYDTEYGVRTTDFDLMEEAGALQRAKPTRAGPWRK